MSPIGTPPPTLKECYDNPSIIYKEPICLMSLSKNVQGNLDLTNREMQKCSTPPCTTLKTIHSITLQLESYDLCEEQQSPMFNGKIIINRLVTAFKDDGLQRGFHAGDFLWEGPGAWGAGRISGMTNVGTHREPILPDCQRCYSPGFMEGRICAHFDSVDWNDLKNSDLIGTYCFKYDAGAGGGVGFLSGVIEAVLITHCQ